MTPAPSHADISSYVREHERPLRSYLRTLTRDEGLIEDAVQNSFLRVLEYDSPRSLLDPRAWLCRVGRNYVVDAQRNAHHHLASLDESVHSHSPSAKTTDPEGVRETLLLRMQKARKQLPARYQEILRLRYDEQLSPATVAERLELSIANVKVLSYRARNFLREHL